MQDLFKRVLGSRSKSYFFLFFISLIFIIVPTALAIDECRGTIENDDIPCEIFLPLNTSLSSCTDVTFSVYNNGSTLLYSRVMAEKNFFTCNTTFNQTELGTYTLFYAGDGFTDTGSMVVEEGNNMILLLYFGIILTIALLAFGLIARDTTFASIGAILMMVIGVFIAINGFSVLNNLVTQAIGIVLICLGAYVLIRTNMESLEE